MKENHASATNHLWSGCVCLFAFAASTCPIHFFLRHTNNATDASLAFGESNVKDLLSSKVYSKKAFWEVADG